MLDPFLELERAYTKSLWSFVAWKLTGRSVEVRWRVPHMAGARAVAGRDGDTGLIVIKPDLEDDQKLASFLHECAHVREHWELLSDDSAQYEAAPASREIPDSYAADDTFQRMEEQAVNQAGIWLEYAQRNAKGPKLRHKLVALLNYGK